LESQLLRLPLVVVTVLVGVLGEEGPGVVPAHLLLLLLGVAIRDVEGVTDLLGCLALHHVGELLAGRVEEPVDAEVVGGVDQVVERVLAAESVCWFAETMAAYLGDDLEFLEDDDFDFAAGDAPRPVRSFVPQ
jgi:hypothetical protein